MSKRIGCHTAYQHYEMFHGHQACCNGGPNIFNCVFNVPRYNNCCGGHMSWWSAVGLGLGMGAANFFTGLLSSFWSTPTISNAKRSPLYDSDAFWNVGKDKKCEDKDLDNINKLWEKVRNVADEAGAKALYKEIKGLIDKPLDDDHKADNITSYKNLLKDLQRTADEKGWDLEGKAKTTAKPPLEVTQPPVVQPKPEVDNTPKPGEVTIGGKKININDIKSLDDIKGLTPDELAKISDNDVIKILDKLGLQDGSELYGKAAKAYEALLLLQRSGLNVNVAYNADTKTNTVRDNWVKGPIQGVNKDKTTGYVNYKVNCHDCGCGKHGNVYQLNQTDDKTFNVTIATFGTNIDYDNPNVTSVDYTITDETKAMNRDGRRFTKDKSIKGN